MPETINTPQEIPAEEAIKPTGVCTNFLGALEAVEEGAHVCLERHIEIGARLAIDANKTPYIDIQGTKDPITVSDIRSQSWLICIPTPETFGKEEARKRLLAGEKVQPVGTMIEYLRFDKDALCIRQRHGHRMTLSDFHDNQLFVKAGE